MPQMDTETARELHLLRSRAYGPSADLHNDSAALQRLRELEDHAKSPTSIPSDAAPSGDSRRPLVTQEFAGTSTDSPAVTQGDGTTAAVSEPAASLDAGEAVAEPPNGETGNPGPRRRLTWPIRLLWAGSVLAAAGIAASVTFGLVAMSPVSASSGAPQIATLHPEPRVEVPSGWFGAGPSSRAWEFHGLTLFETTGGMYGPGGTGDCFAVVTTEDIPPEEEVDQNSWSISGIAYSACRVGAFPATIAIQVGSSTPDDLRATYPDSTLQFVKQGDQIGVFLDKQ
jgi:hypothetical protein